MGSFLFKLTDPRTVVILIKLLARVEYTRSTRRIALVLKFTVRWRKMVVGGR